MENTTLKNDSVPFGISKIVLSIIAILTSPILVGFIAGVVAIFLTDKDNQMVKGFPNNYSESALKTHNTGKILSWVAFIVSVLVAFYVLYNFGKYGTLDSSNH